MTHKIYKQYWRCLEPPGHIRVFMQEALKNIVEKRLEMNFIFMTSRNADLMFASSHCLRSKVSNPDFPKITIQDIIFQYIGWIGKLFLQSIGEEIVIVAEK